MIAGDLCVAGDPGRQAGQLANEHRAARLLAEHLLQERLERGGGKVERADVVGGLGGTGGLVARVRGQAWRGTREDIQGCLHIGDRGADRHVGRERRAAARLRPAVPRERGRRARDPGWLARVADR